VPKDESFPIDENCDPNLPSPLWVVLCSKVKYCGPRTAICSPDDEDAKPECTRERDGYEIQIVRGDTPPCACGCPADTQFDPAWDPDCQCVDPTSPCYEAHYQGKCGCDCNDCSDCDCKCVLLARLEKDGATDNWLVRHRFRRFVRPVLMSDWVVRDEEPRPNVALNQQSILHRRVETAAMVEAEKTIREAAEKAAHDAARRAAKDIAQRIGNDAAAAIVKKVAPREVAVEAVEQVVRDTAKPAARRKTAGLPAAALESRTAGTKTTKKTDGVTEPTVTEPDEPVDPQPN
jgi:hypothetical protein